MNVIYLCADPGIPYWGTKGASIHVREFTTALREAGHDVTVVMARGGRAPHAGANDTPIVEIPAEDESFFKPSETADASEAALLYEARQFQQNRAAQDVINDLLANRPCDVICERYSLFSIAGLESARWHGVRFALEVNAPLVTEARLHRQLIMEPLAKSIERYLFSKADHVFPVSRTLGEYIHGVAPSARVTPLPNGVHLLRFLSAADGSRWRSRWMKDSSNGFLLGFVGSLRPWHGTDLLLEAFRLARNRCADCRLVIVGDGPGRGAIEQKIQEYKLEDWVTLTGAVAHEEIPDILQAIDVLVAPYPTSEGFYFSPLKIFEYMAAGKPIVASAIGQVVDILTHGDTAILTPPGDAAALSEALSLLRVDPAYRDRLGRRAREVAATQHEWKHRVRQWEEHLAGTVLQPESVETPS